MATLGPISSTSNSNGLQSAEVSDYATARAGGGAVSTDDPAYTIGGQRLASTTYYVNEGFIEFDLTSLPAGATVTAVDLSIRSQSYKNSPQGDLNVYVEDYGSSVTTADWVDLTTFSGTLLATFATAGWTVSAYNDFTENGSNFQTAVAAAAGGPLRLLVVSSRAVAGTAPTGSEYVTYYSYDASLAPQLTITYTTPSSVEHAAATVAASQPSIGIDTSPGNASATVSGYDITSDISASAGHASVTVTSYIVNPSTDAGVNVNAEVATIGLWSSEADHSELDTSAEHASLTITSYSTSEMRALAEHASFSVSAQNTLVTFSGIAQAGHASISVASNTTSHGASAEHASFTMSSGSPLPGVSPNAGLASSQFKMESYTASVTSDIITNVNAGAASITLSVPDTIHDVETSAEMANIIFYGLSITTPSIDADIVASVYSSTTIKVDEYPATTIVVSEA